LAVAGLSSAGYGSPQSRDIVTEYNSGADWSETRFYDGTDWSVVDQYLNGNLFIDGTIAGTKIIAGSITADKIEAGALVVADASITSAKIATIIQSNDFVSGVSGWYINKGGVAEFQSVVIGASQIGTLQIADNAVTVASAAQATDTIAASGSWSSILTIGGINVGNGRVVVNISAVPQPFVIYDSITGDLRYEYGILYRIVRDGSTVVSSVGTVYLDIPGSGSHTYTLQHIQDYSSGSGGYGTSGRSMVISGAKK
jgi:hypothetical protein